MKQIFPKKQFDFRLGRSIIEVIYLLKQFMKKYREKGKDMSMVFINLEKVYERVHRDL